MVAGKTNKKELLQFLEDTTSQFFELVSSFDEDEINTMPRDGAWTVGQVAEHVTRSNVNIANELSQHGKISDRAPDARVDEIRSIFLDFNKKLKSPEFILPTRHSYAREILIKELGRSIDELKEVSNKEDLLQIVNHTIFGEITRLETIYFVVYHTQRHIHQLTNIQTIIQRKKKK